MTIRSARYLSRTLQYDADVGCFRCYAKTKTPLTVYRGETSSLWYTTQPKMHDHQLVETGRREPTCTMSGWIDFRCTICGAGAAGPRGRERHLRPLRRSDAAPVPGCAGGCLLL